MPDNKTGVLIVDDEDTDLAALRRTLENAGRFLVFTAMDYNEAVEAFGKHSKEIALAILDIALPGQNGVELAKYLLALKPGLSVLFVSGHVGASVIRFYGVEVGDEHFLEKPFDGVTLLSRIEKAMASIERLPRVLSARIQ